MAGATKFDSSLLACFLFFSCVAPSFPDSAGSPVRAQESCQSAEIAATAVLSDGRLLRGLSPAQLEIRVNKAVIDQSAITPDAGSRRILLLIDLNRRLNSDVWAAITMAAIHIVERARPEDNFAMLTFGGPRVLLSFGTPRPAILHRLREMQAGRPALETREVLVRDALADGLEVFGTPQYGDAIVVFFGGEDTASQTSLERLKKLTEAAPVRLFGFAFGTLYHGSLGVSSFDFSTTIIWGNPFNEMVVNTGGAILIGYSGHPQRAFKLTPEYAERLRNAGWRLYGQIKETYRIAVPLPTAGKDARVEIRLSQELLARFPGAFVRHLHSLSPCTSP